MVMKKARDRIKEIDNNGDNENSFQNSNSDSVFIMQMKSIRNFFIIFKSILFDPYLFYYLVYTTFAILGFFNQIFIALLLLDVFLRFLIIFFIFFN